MKSIFPSEIMQASVFVSSRGFRKVCVVANRSCAFFQCVQLRLHTFFVFGRIIMEQTHCRNCNAVLESGWDFCPVCGNLSYSENQQYQYIPSQYDYNLQSYYTPLTNGFGTAGMALGIVSTALILFSCLFMPKSLSDIVLKVICMTVAEHGLPLSIVGMCRRFRPKAKAAVGLGLNIFSLTLSLVGYLNYFL